MVLVQVAFERGLVLLVEEQTDSFVIDLRDFPFVFAPSMAAKRPFRLNEGFSISGADYAPTFDVELDGYKVIVENLNPPALAGSDLSIVGTFLYRTD